MIISNHLTAQNELYTNTEQFTIKKSVISSNKSEFGAILTNDKKVYFARENSTVKASDSIGSLDIYKTSFENDGDINNISAVSSLNTKWHDGPVAITSDGKTMYFSSESFNAKKGFIKEVSKKNILKKGKIYLYKATLVENKWTNITPLPINNPKFSNRNPCISSDNKTLYFSSNRPGGFGGEDIWKVSIQGNSFEKVENLGAKINSSNNESFPHITSDNYLFFASDSPKGFGGLDIYKINLSNLTNVENLGTPINSDKDDFSFSFNTVHNIGLFSSNRDGDDDIYIANPICQNFTNITIIDSETGKNITNSTLLISNHNRKLDSIQSTQEKTSIHLACNEQYSFTINSDGYENYNHIIQTPVKGEDLEILIKLNPTKKAIITDTEVILQPIYFDFNKSEITAQGASELDKLVTVMNEHPKMIIFVKSHTDLQGNEAYNLKLSNKRADATVNYILSKGINKNRISGKGFGETEPKIKCEICNEEQNIKNRRSEFKIITK